MKTVSSFPPILYPKARILILGSMPSARSLKEGEYYGHPQNQFWEILTTIYESPELENYSEKKILLKNRRIALWDVLSRCKRHGSADASIGDVDTNDIPALLKENPSIQHIVLNGRTAEKYYRKVFGKNISLPAFYVPSTSPANAGFSFQQKITLWRKGLLAD